MEVKTNTLILTFNSPKIPDSLKICYMNIPVTQYVPNPLRCYKCQRFGHVTSKCKHNETCAKCSETGVADVKKTAAPARSSPAKKGEKSSKPSSPKQQSAPVPESDAYFTIKTNRGKVKENSPITNVRISPIKFKESMLKKERLKRSYQASDFLPDVEISPSRSDLIKNSNYQSYIGRLY